jgi:hypothetical protein
VNRTLALVLPVLFASCNSSPPDPLPAGPDASADAGASCNELVRLAGERLAPALRAATADLSCQTDDDCFITPAETNCGGSCGTLVNRQAANAIAAAIGEINTDVCSAFMQQGCFRSIPPCVPRRAGAACVSGRCAEFPATLWRKLIVDRHAGTSVSIPPSCASGQDCTVWTVSPDRAVVKVDRGQYSTATLSEADFATLDGILRSLAFRGKELMGFQCGPPPATSNVSFAIERDFATTGFDVGACLAAQSDADAVNVYQVVSAY